jgi:DNA-binding transcriptional regulator YdaS (Cro superfamily)
MLASAKAMSRLLFALAKIGASRYRVAMGHGSALLWEFLQRRNAPQCVVARVLRVSPPAVHDWLSGRRTPTPAYREAIERWSEGAVPAASWRSEAEAELAEQLEAIAPLEGL